MRLQGKRALVTGGGVRVGRALCLALAGEGCHVFVHFGSSEAQAAETARQARELGVRAQTGGADLADPKATLDLVGRAQQSLGGLEILINNASIYPPGGLSGTEAATWDRVLAINLRAPFLLIRELARLGSGRAVLNLVDAASRHADPDHLAYRASKAALEAMTRDLALELAPDTRVNALALGSILAPPGQAEEDFVAAAAGRVPIGRPGGIDAVTRAAFDLLTHDYLTGVVLPVDGGEHL